MSSSGCLQVEPSQWKPSEEELKAAEIVEPWHHPVGLLQASIPEPLSRKLFLQLTRHGNVLSAW